MSFNYATGEWEDNDHPNPGDVGAQTDSPVMPMPLPAGPPPVTPPVTSVAPAGGPPVVTADEPIVIDAGKPDVLPQVQPYTPQPVEPIPASRVVPPAEAANLGAIDANAAAGVQTAQDKGELGQAAAKEKEYAAARDAYTNQGFEADRARIADDFAKRVADREKQAQADYQAFKSFGIKDPEADDSFATRILKAIAIGLGGYAAGMNGGANQAYQIIRAANQDNIARQKAEQEKLFRIAEKSGQDVEAAKRERDDVFKQLDLKHAALLDSSAAQLKAEMARLGVPQAQIAANENVQAIEKDALALRQRTLQSIRDDATELARADINAAVQRDRLRAQKAAKGKGGGGDNPAKMEAKAQLAEYALANPGDTPGIRRLAAKLNLGEKDVSAALNQNKVTEGAGKDAQQGAVALRAIDSIQQSGYAPSREDVQKWMSNQRDVARAQQLSEGKGVSGFLGSGLANLAQKKGALAQNEFDGLSPKAREYFTNVRRYMETIGRVQSGAAISNSEWQNFYGQYGPQSAGGLEAAKQFAKDRFKMSGTAGRVLERSDGAPAQGGGRGEDPRVKLAREALNDPNATNAVKARALQILHSLGEGDKL